MEYVATTGLMQGSFRCFACPCEVLVETTDQKLAERVLDEVAAEAKRIEHKFSRYRDDNLVHAINQAGGRVITVDEETARLLDFAQECYTLSQGLFDITSGLLRKAWRFGDQARIPTRSKLTAILRNIGWNRVEWNTPHLRLHKGMEIDFGGFGKEYAVDRCLIRAREVCQAPLLLNFGGDLVVSGPQSGNRPWRLAVENPPELHITPRYLDIFTGAVATSGDNYRCIVDGGIRYGHILNPKTGYPVPKTPNSVTVWAANSTQAGLLSTLAMLQGEKAEDFLEHEIVDQETPDDSDVAAKQLLNKNGHAMTTRVLSSHYWFVWRNHRLCERFAQ